MPFSQPTSSAIPYWSKFWLACASLLLVVACADRSEEAMRYAAEAERYFEAGNLLEARRSIGEALQQRDDLPELHLLRGRIEFSAEAYENAYAAYANALALDNANMEALQAISQLGLRTGNIPESLDATERILALRPSQEDALLVRGLHALVKRRYGEAIEYADRVLATRPSEQATILKSRALFLSGKSAEALEVIDSFADGSADSVGIARTKLEIYRETKNPEGMEAQFARLRQLLPADPALVTDEANFRFKRGEVGAGQDLLVELLRQEDLAPESAAGAIDLLGDYSVDLPQGALERISASANDETLIQLARHLIDEQRLISAQLIVHELPPKEARPLSARLALLGKRPSEARQIASEIISKDETNCDALIALSRAALIEGDKLDALRSAQRATAECPSWSGGWFATAAAYSARNEPISVQRVLRDAINANPQNFAITKKYGDYLIANGKDRQALAVARSFTHNSPALVRGWEYYRSLCTKVDAECASEAEQGLADARTRFGIDLRVGEVLPNGLFGRLIRR